MHPKSANLIAWAPPISESDGRAGVGLPEYLQPGDHPNKDIKKVLTAIFDAEPGEWYIVKGGHWGTLRCLGPCGCTHPIPGTPKNPSGAARRLKREAGKHPRPDDDPRHRAARE